MPKWFDMGKQGVRLRYVVDPNAKRWILVLLGLTKDSEEWRACIEGDLRFRPAPSGKAILVRPFSATDKLELNAVRAVFPSARRIDIADPSEVRLHLDGGASMSPQEAALAAAMRIASLVGINAVSQRVFETPAGVRFLIDSDGKNVGEDGMPGALFLRGNESNLSACAQGFVAGLMAGTHAEVSDVKRFVDVLYGAGASDDRERVERVSQAIESEMAARILDRHQIAGDGAYREAQALYENAPPHMGDPKGAGAVPLPVAVATQEIVRAFGGEDQMAVYAPQIFDGALVSMLGQWYITLTDPVDPESREGQMRRLIPGSVNIIERQPNEAVAPHRVSILNVEDAQAETLDRLKTDLMRRHPNGMSVLLVPEHNNQGDAEKAASKERIARFVKDMQGDLSVAGVGMVSSVMRKKLGLQSGLMMLVVGHRYSAKEKQIRGTDWIPAQVTTMYDWDALRTFTNDTLVRVHEAAGRKLSAAEEAALRANESEENSYQLPYQSFSKNGEVELMIPRNLAGSTYKALQNLQDRVGDLDAYLKNAIGFSDEQYGYLAPEQVDAGALMIAAFDRSKGFILGDQTGAGKGVTLAMAVAYAWERGFPVVFVTKQDNLFNDFYRDLKKTGLHEKMRPMVLNHTASIVDQFSDNLEKVGAGISRKEFLANYRFGLSGFDNPNIIFTTYSQFSAGSESEKSDWIRSVAPNAFVVFDEAHIAAGDTSKLGGVCTEIANLAKAVAYSSATWLKDARQVGFYERALPASVDAQMVADAMRTGGESIQEVFTSMLAEDGLFIRRERDASQLEINSVTDEVRLTSNEGVANQVSVILQGLQRLCGVTDQVGRRLTKSQVDKLDAARKFIESALERARAEALEAQRNASAARAARRGQDDADDLDADGGDELPPGVDPVTIAQQVVNDQESMRNQAEAENEAFFAAGQADTVIDAEGVEDRNGADDVVDLVRQNDITLADLGLSESMTNQLAADLEYLNGAGNTDAKDRLTKEVRRIQRMIKGISTRTTSFGSLLFLTQRTLNVSLQARFAADRAIEKIRDGQKPIIFLEQTFEARLAEQLESPDAIKNEDGTISIKPITLKDNLREMYTSIVNMSHVDADGERYEGSIMDSKFMATDTERETVREGLATLDEMIENLPDDLYCSPIDTIAHAIRQAGFTVGEATGRKYHVVDMHDGMWKVALRKKNEAKIPYIERAFNFGDFDALIGNKAMSTGMSVHASREFSDRRQRVMMFCQVFADINDYIQAIGRADRRGQVLSPVVEMLASGLPSEARVMMNHHDKLRKLLASTTSNRSSRFEQQELPDLFNTVGDMSVRDFLQANPAIATRLGIDFNSFMPTAIRPNGTEVEVQTHGLAKYVVARLDLLPVAESRAVYQEIAYNFEEVLAELDAQGINPLRTNVLDLTDAESALVTAREDLLPALLNEHGTVESVFDEAVELHTVTAKYTLSARTWEETLATIEKNTRQMYFDSMAFRASNRGNPDVRPDFVPDQEIKPIYFSNGQDAQGPLLGAVRMVPAGLRERVTKMFDGMQLMMRSSDRARSAAGSSALAESMLPDALPPGQVPGDGRTTNGVNPIANVPVTPAQVVERRKAWLLRNLQYFMPGEYVAIAFHNQGWSERQSMRGVVTELNIPPRGRETNLTRWSITVQLPGRTDTVRYTLQELYKASFTGMNQWLPAAEHVEDGLFRRTVPDEFNEYTDAERKTSRYVLKGNLFRAASIAAEKNMGAGGVLLLKNEPPSRVISIRRDMTKQNIYASVPVEISPDEVANLFCSTWEGLDQPPRANAKYWSDFLRMSLDNRAIHSTKEGKNSSVSIYWLAKRASFSAQLTDELSEQEREELRRSEAEEDEENPHLLDGVGLRIQRHSVDPALATEFVRQVNAAVGYEAVETLRGRQGSNSVRYVVRFKDPEGNRDSNENIQKKLACFTRAAAQTLGVGRFYTYSPEMRLLALAVSAKSREQARQLRDAAEETRQMRVQMSRMQFAESVDEDEADEHAEPPQDALPIVEG